MKINYLGYRAEESIFEPAAPGADVHLTIDAVIQKAAEQALRSQSVETKGAVIVMDVRNGDILAMASNPTFNPGDFIPRMSPDLWERLNDPDRKAFLNRATNGSYAPGSIFKIVVGVAGLERGVIEPDRVFTYPRAYFEKLGRRIGDTAPPGAYDFARAFKKSSNQYFISHGERIGRAAIVEWAERFGLGAEETGVPINQETGGYLPSAAGGTKRNGAPWRDGDTWNLSIGQGEVLVTPIQVACMVSAVANGGRLYWPRLVTAVTPQDVTFGRRRSFPPRLRREIPLSPRTVETIHRAMRADVADGYGAPGGHGSGYRSEVPGMNVCGKTGTAEVDFNPKVRKITWFASFAPLEAPRYAVVVMVENGASGQDTCGPIAGAVYRRIQDRERALARAR